MKNEFGWRKIGGASLAVCCATMFLFCAAADEPNAETPAPFTDWQKLVTLLKERYADKGAVTDARLNEAMVKGIQDAFGNRARIVEAGAELAKPSQSIAHTEAIGGTIGYVRFAVIDETSAAALDKELEKMGKGKLSGLVIDLRFADGNNYFHAAAVVSRFVAKGAKLFTVRDIAENKTQEFVNADIEGAMYPIAVLVNGQTRGAAEAVAGALRAQDRCIVIGNVTAGLAAVFSDFQLDARRTLRLATGKVEFPKSIEAFPKGLTPDARVELSEAVERDVLLENPPKKSFTELFAPRETRGRLNEAELVKQHRGEVTTLLQPTGTTREKPEEIKDATLQRAVDLLRGVAALKGN